MSDVNQNLDQNVDQEQVNNQNTEQLTEDGNSSEKKKKKEKILTPAEQMERSILKKYRKQIWTPFVNAVKKYELIQENDRICICISGGKDSMLLAKLMQMLHRFSDFPFEIEFLVMDPGYNKVNRDKIESNAALLEIPITIYESEIFDIANATEKSPCYLCARMRRGHLYAKAKEMGCNKIALGHHRTDVIETTLMGMLYGAQIQGMMPKLHSLNFEGMELIRPLYEIDEESIISWRDYNNLTFIQCACRFTEGTTVGEEGESNSKRMETKMIIKKLREMNPGVENNIFNSLHNVSVDTFLEYKSNGVRHSFLENYDEKREQQRKRRQETK